ncbi:hypothetical protein [Niallia oryzisoli]
MDNFHDAQQVFHTSLQIYIQFLNAC